jgi:carbamoyltransferase
MPSKEPWVLGISASHNGAVCLLKGDEIVAAVQEERLSRVKRDRIYGAEPALAITYCLTAAGIEPKDLSMVVLCIQGRARHAIHHLTQNQQLNVRAHGIPTIVIPHHYGHALSVFATSGFADAAILVVDGTGSPIDDFIPAEQALVNGRFEDGWETASLYSGDGVSVKPLRKHIVEHGRWLGLRDSGMYSFGSLGGMYSAVAHQIFGDPMDAGKVMGLAPYGAPVICRDDFFEIEDDEFKFKEQIPAKFRHDERWPARAGEYEALAASVQAALEHAVMHLIGRLRESCSSENLCYAGGVALNSVANEQIIRESGFRNVYIMPPAEDSGTAVGAAYYGLWQITGNNTRRPLIRDACGRNYGPDVITASVANQGLREDFAPDIISETVDLLCEGKIVGWFDGRSELGPRALGQRSILCDPRNDNAKEILNARVKMREAFRPFAPAVLLDEARHWFQLDGVTAESPFMLRVCKLEPSRISAVPAITHVDGTGRLQTVTPEANGRFHHLIKAFFDKTGVPMILNTSFNVMGEPIVETPEDAIACLMKTQLDCCVFEDRIVWKNQ